MDSEGKMCGNNYTSYCLMDSYYVLRIVLRTLHVLSHVGLLTTLKDRYHHHTDIADEKTEA